MASCHCYGDFGNGESVPYLSTGQTMGTKVGGGGWMGKGECKLISLSRHGKKWRLLQFTVTAQIDKQENWQLHGQVMPGW